VSLSKSPAIADCALAQLRLLLHCLLQALQYEVAIVRCFVIGATQFPEWCQQAVAQVECLETHAMGVTCLSNIRRISSKGQLLVMAVNILLSLQCWPQCIECVMCPQTGHITLSSTPYRQLENQSTKYHRQQPPV